MAQGDFTKQEVQFVRKAFDEVFNALPKSKKFEFIGHANDIYLFLSKAERIAPEEKPEVKAG